VKTRILPGEDPDPRVERLEPDWSASSAIWEALDEGRCEVIDVDVHMDDRWRYQNED